MDAGPVARCRPPWAQRALVCCPPHLCTGLSERNGFLKQAVIWRGERSETRKSTVVQPVQRRLVRCAGLAFIDEQLALRTLTRADNLPFPPELPFYGDNLSAFIRLNAARSCLEIRL